MIRFEPLMGTSAWIALLALTAVGLLVHALRRPAAVGRRPWAVIVGLRAAAAAAILMILLNPTRLTPVPLPAGRPVLHILVDASASMAADDAGDGQTRYAAAVSLAHRLADLLADRWEIRVARFAAESHPVRADHLLTLAPDGESTDLARAIRACLNAEGPPGHAIVLLSDGIHNAPEGLEPLLDAARMARARGSPIHTAVFGGELSPPVITVALTRPQETGLTGQVIPVSVQVRSRGLGGTRASIILEVDDQPAGRQDITLDDDEPAIAVFTVSRDTAGLYRLQTRVESETPGDIPNWQPAVGVLRITDRPIRMLLLEGRPSWDTGFLTRALAADPAIAMDSVIRLAERRFLHRHMLTEVPATGPEVVQAAVSPDGMPATSPAAPGRTERLSIVNDPALLLGDPEAIRRYHILLLGREAECFLTDPMLPALERWIARDGGQLVCFRGRPVNRMSPRLGALLPLHGGRRVESRYRMRFTPEGRQSGWVMVDATTPADRLLEQLPPWTRSGESHRMSPATVALTDAAAGPDFPRGPAIAWMPFGIGRVVTVEGAGMWRWALKPLSDESPEPIYEQFWQSLIHWLVASASLLPGQTLALQADKVLFNTMENCSATLILGDERASADGLEVVLAEAGGGERRHLAPLPAGDTPGVFRVTFGRLPVGQYLVEVLRDGQTVRETGARTRFEVAPFRGEYLDLSARPELMARIAAESGGAAIEGGQPADLIAALDRLPPENQVQGMRPITLWDRWWVLSAVVGLWAATWLLRRRGGLI